MNFFAKPYRQALVFAGGGMRFGYYLGVYQAFCEQRGVPDVILASCGGAISAAILHTASHPKDAYDLLCSRACYELCCRIYGLKPPSWWTYMLPALKRWLLSQACRYRPALIQKEVSADELYGLSVSLFGVSDPKRPLWQTSVFAKAFTTIWQSHPKRRRKHYPPINSVMILSRLTGDHQWQQVLRPSNDKLDATLKAKRLSSALHPYNTRRIKRDIDIQKMPLAVATQASVNDMYYMSPLIWQKQILMGGVLDLMPVEIASSLAEHVFIDDKIAYNCYLAEPAILACFGFFANQRLHDVKNNSHSAQVHWLPLANHRHIRPLVDKKFCFQHGYIQGVYPDFATFKQIVHEQYVYGYQQTHNYLKAMI